MCPLVLPILSAIWYDGAAGRVGHRRRRPRTNELSRTRLTTSPDPHRVRMASASADDYEFTHDAAHHRFLLSPKGHKGVAALIEYAEARPGVLDLHHTEVPPPLQGKGIAGILTTRVMNHIKENKYMARCPSPRFLTRPPRLKMMPSCTYISDTYLPRHPEYNDLVAQVPRH